MKTTPPSLSMALPVTTSSCVATRPPSSSSSSRLEVPSNNNSEKSAPKEQYETTHVSSTPTKRRQNKPPVALRHSLPPPPPPARFSTGVTAVTMPIVIAQPPASLSLMLQHPQQQRSVTVYTPLKPPRVQPTSLSSILIPETNLISFKNESVVSSTVDVVGSTCSDWFPLENWTPLVKDMATLIALDVLKVFIIQGTLQVFCKRALFRYLKTWQRQQALVMTLPSRNLATPSVSCNGRLVQPRQDDWTVRGLPNYGQSCFMNSVLQALTSVDSFLVYLQQVVLLQHYSSTTCNDNKTCTSLVLWNLLQSLQHSSMPRVDPRLLLKQVAHSNKQFQGGRLGGEQQDAQEFLQALIELVVKNAQLESTFQNTSLESSILSNLDGEMVSLAAFITRMNQEQSKMTAMNDLKQSEMNGNHTVVSTETSHQNSHSNGFDTKGRYHEKRNDPDIHASIEEKKQEDFEHPSVMSSQGSLPPHANIAPTIPPPTPKLDTAPLVLNDDDTQESLDQHSSSTLLMLKTLSPSTPSPLSGWLGSTLECCSCRHVRPIQNAPFLDIPIVPLSISHYMSVHGGMKQPLDSQPCSLADCLREFTSVERVSNVECRNCSIQADIAALQEEVFMLQGAIQTIQARKTSDQVEGLQSELERAESKLTILQQVNPDDDFDGLQDFTASMDEIDLGVVSKRKPLKRVTAKKCLLLTRLPNVLCLHVQRRYYDSSTERMAKTRQHVEFQEVLDLSPYCAYGGGKAGMPSWAGSGSATKTANTMKHASCKLYRLASVIEHCGDAFSGHYQTYRRVRTPGNADQWVLISDARVTPIRWSDVQRCQAYMLFYEAM